MALSYYNMVNINENKNKAILFFAKEQINQSSRLVFAVLTISMMCVFINNSLQTITGPIMAICFTYLYLAGYNALVASIIIVANDALGCILMGNISFPYLLLAFTVLTLLSKGLTIQIRRSQMLAGIILIIMLVTLYYYNIIEIKNIIYTLTFIFAAVQSVSNFEDRALFFKGIAITVFLISLHTCITGGVEFYELNEYSTAFLRKGIIGVGIGDSNFSSLLLNVGIVTTLFDKDFKWYLKISMTVFAVSAMSVTLSTSGLIGFLLVMLGYIYIKRESVPKKLWNTLVVILLMLLIANIYVSLPNTMKNETIDAYVSRIQEKLNFINVGDVSDFTTGRSDLSNEALRYIFNEQGSFGLLFGLNSLFVGTGSMVPHNTYIDLLLQIGLIGTSVALEYILYGIISAWKDTHRNRMEILLKIVFLYYFMNLSIYQGSMFAIAYVVLIVL